MSQTGSLHKAVTKISLLATTVLSGLLAFSALPESPIRIPSLQTEQRSVLVESANEVNAEVVLAVALASSAAVGIGLTAVVERDRDSYSASSRRFSSRQHTVQPAALDFAQVSRPLQRKLLRLLHEDRGAAHRLFAHASLKYPGNHPDWYAEKIIYDLVRDRGKY